MDKEIRRILKIYSKNLEERGIQAQKILLFGSYAKGSQKAHSDLDLLVISEDFKGMDLWERLSLLGRARIGIEKPMEILGLTEEEYQLEKEGTFIGDEVKPLAINILERG